MFSFVGLPDRLPSHADLGCSLPPRGEEQGGHNTYTLLPPWPCVRRGNQRSHAAIPAPAPPGSWGTSREGGGAVLSPPSPCTRTVARSLGCLSQKPPLILTSTRLPQKCYSLLFPPAPGPLWPCWPSQESCAGQLATEVSPAPGGAPPPESALPAAAAQIAFPLPGGHVPSWTSSTPPPRPNSSVTSHLRSLASLALLSSVLREP